MKLVRTIGLAAAMGFLAACSGSSSNQPLFVDAAPSYSALTMDQLDSDVAPETSGLVSSMSSGDMLARRASSICHPHLFVRTREVVTRNNRHLYKFLHHIELTIATTPATTSGDTWSWELTRGGVERRFTITRVSTMVYDWKLELKDLSAQTPLFVTVLSGQIDRTGATGPHQGSGTLLLDLSALHDVFPAEAVQGQVNVAFATTSSSRKIEVTTTNVSWDVADAAADPDVLAALRQPRSGHYVYFREPGVGGSLKIEDQMIFLCPANSQLELADVALISRWYRYTDGSVHGRSDAILTGGQLPDTQIGGTPIANIQGITCHLGSSESDEPIESYWMMKAESASGATLQSFASDISSGGSAEIACDSAFGQVPSRNDDASDFDFSSISFDDSSVVPFPGMQ